MIPRDEAVEAWEKDGIKFYILKGLWERHNGYCEFPERPTIEQGDGGILAYVPVHGGITYASEGEHGEMVYGFDCGHAGDDERPELLAFGWLRAECEKMAACIKAAVPFEERYLLARTDDAKIAIVDEYAEQVGGLDFDTNPILMLKVMCGGI